MRQLNPLGSGTWLSAKSILRGRSPQWPTRFGLKIKNGIVKFMSCLVLCCITVGANATTWRDALPGAQLIGSGVLHWYGLRIYTAKLWSESHPFDANAPYALELTYHRNISREQFVDTSLKEIKRIFGKRYDSATLVRWENEMQRAFLDVQANDQLIGVFVPNKGCDFYSAGKQLAQIRDTEFANAFFAIWFDERARNPELSAQLRGRTP